MKKYRVSCLYNDQKFPLQDTYGDALDLIRAQWLPDYCYDNPVTFKFDHSEKGVTLVRHQTTSFRIEEVEVERATDSA